MKLRRKRLIRWGVLLGLLVAGLAFYQRTGQAKARRLLWELEQYDLYRDRIPTARDVFEPFCDTLDGCDSPREYVGQVWEDGPRAARYGTNWVLIKLHLRDPPRPDLWAIEDDLVALGEDAVPALLDAIKSYHYRLRLRAARVLGDIGPVTGEVIPALIEILTSEDPNAKDDAAYALGKMGPAAKEAVPALAEALKQQPAIDSSMSPDAVEYFKYPYAEARASAALALARMGPAAMPAMPALEVALKDECPKVRVFAAWAVSRLGRAEEGIPVLLQALRGKDYNARNAAIHVLGEIAPPSKEVVLALSSLHEKGNTWHTRMWAVRSLGKIGQRSKDADGIVIVLTMLLEHQDERLRCEAAQALGQIGPPAKGAIRKLRDAAAGPDPSLQVWAIYALGRIEEEPEAAIAKLLTHLRGTSTSERCYAALAIGAFGPPAKAATPELIDALSDGDSIVRRCAARALGNLGPAAQEAIPALRGALRDEERGVRRAAAEALKSQTRPATAGRRGGKIQAVGSR